MTFPMWFSCSMEPQVWICYSYNRRRPGIPAPDTACLRELGWWDPTKQWLFVDRIGLGLLLNWFHRGGNFQWSWLIVYCFFSDVLMYLMYPNEIFWHLDVSPPADKDLLLAKVNLWSFLLGFPPEVVAAKHFGVLVGTVVVGQDLHCSRYNTYPHSHGKDTHPIHQPTRWVVQ